MKQEKFEINYLYNEKADFYSLAIETSNKYFYLQADEFEIYYNHRTFKENIRKIIFNEAVDEEGISIGVNYLNIVIAEADILDTEKIISEVMVNLKEKIELDNLYEKYKNKKDDTCYIEISN